MGTPADITLNGGGVSLGGEGGSLLYLIRELGGRPVSSGSEDLPFLKRPEDLTQNEWHLVFHDQIGDSEVAAPWRLKEESRRITMDPPILCWQIIREFHETDGQKTDWMMLEYKITTPSESFSLCRIWQGPGSVYGFPSADPSVSETFASGNYLSLEDLVD